MEVGSMDRESLQSEKPEIVLSKKRWIVLLIFAFFGFTNQVQYTTFSTVVRQVQSHYGVNAVEVNILSVTFPILYFTCVLPSCTAVERLGQRRGIVLGTSLNALGAIVKFITAVAYPQYWMLLVGQIISGIGQLLFLGLPPLVAATWFGASERTLATALGTLSGFLGLAVGMFYSPLIVNNDHEGRLAFSLLFGSQAVVSTLTMIGAVVLVENAPPSSPSVTANRRTEAVSVFETTKKLFKKRNFLFLIFSVGMFNGIFTGLLAILSQSLEPFGISEKETGILGLVGLLCGSVACALVGGVVDKYRRYKLPLLIIQFEAFSLCALLLFCMKYFFWDATGREAHSEGFTICMFVIVIMVMTIALTLIPVAMELAVELTFPLPESISVGMVMGSLSFFSVVAVFIYSFILGNKPTRDESFWGYLATEGLILVCIIVMGTIKEDLARHNFEKIPSSPHESQGLII